MQGMPAPRESQVTVNLTALHASPISEVWDTWLHAGWELLRRATPPIGTWRQRAWERQVLSRMGEHELKDLGLTAQLARWEVNKPFWKD